jgi:hypothetical protein
LEIINHRAGIESESGPGFQQTGERLARGVGIKNRRANPF